jgi:hypothetical protein
LTYQLPSQFAQPSLTKYVEYWREEATANPTLYRYNETTGHIYYKGRALVFNKKKKEWVKLPHKDQTQLPYSDTFPSFADIINQLDTRPATRRSSCQTSQQGSQQTSQAHTPTITELVASPLSAVPTLPTLDTAVQVLTQDSTQQDNNNETDTDKEEHQPQEPSPTIKGESVSVSIPSAAKGKAPASLQPNQKPTVPVIQTAGATSSSHATNVTTAAPPPPPPTQVHTQTTRPALLQNMSSSQGAAANAPKPFSGDRSKAKAFICQCLLYFQACPQDFWIDSNTKTVDEQKKIAWTLLFLDDGYAAGWRDKYIDKVATNNCTAWKDRAEFQREFESRFNDTMEKTTAQHQLKGIRVQKGETIDRFNQRFADLARIASFNEEAQKVLYMKALPWWMHDRIIDLEVQPKDVPSLMAKALHYDLLSKQRRQGQRPNNNLYTVPAR